MREYFGIVYRKIQKNRVETLNKIAGLTITGERKKNVAFRRGNFAKA